MRLIDVNRLLEDFEKLVMETPKNEKLTILELYDLFEYAPTIEAIPVEWVKEYAEKQFNEVDPTTCYDIQKMIDDWEKENEHTNNNLN